MNDHMITVLYTFIDDFFKSFFKTKLWKNLRHYWINKRGPKKKLSLSEVVTLNIIRFYLRTEDLKTFHKNAEYSFVKL